MSSHRGRTRRSDVRPPAGGDGRVDTTVQRGVSVEETFLPDVDLLPRPAGFGTEASRTIQSFGLIDEYVVPAKTVAYLREISVSLESNGEAKVSVAGTTYGPYTGQTDISIPLDPGQLTAGSKIRIHHQSTDGNQTTTRAQVVVLEV